MTTIDATPIRTLNDRFRKDMDFSLGRWVMTRGVNDKGVLFVQRACRAVREFDQFNNGNDPHREHDLGRMEVDGETVLWKIDYFDPDLQHGSEDPSDPAKCHRILTVMLGEEY
ncbi:DUF3768 domain-containing protein [Caulobacter sp. FWC2]|uniref:DUF3768 domain-containing protein n=1 Tax=Caulobacter sp. FWC2 TaxID=69664 RepID=UPI000C15DBEC|nr:DUF3768 domain-containing protein [Caulobacter sp. FWC2]PIB91010.1 hypothetical protein CSW62_05145 [Caulobacter sp. FWC2]